MGKFRRVADTQGVPEYIKDVVFDRNKQSEDDPYEYLRKTHSKRVLKIAKETIDYNKGDAQKTSNDWEKIVPAQKYSDKKIIPEDETLSNLNPEDVSVNSVRRISFDVDEDNARGGIYDMSNRNSVSNALRGASLFEYDMEDIKDSLIKENEGRENIFSSYKQREIDYKKRHSEWEKEQVSRIRQPKIVTSRANPILRTSIENTADSRFGLMNFEEIENREFQMKEIMDRKMKEKEIISRKSLSREERNKEWEGNMNVRTSSLQEKKVSWLDQLAEEL